MKSIRGINLFVLLGLAALSIAQGDPRVVAAVHREAKERSQAMATIRELSEEIGTRLTASTGGQRAEKWAVDRFREMGLEVRLEEFLQVPEGFDRGRNQVLRMVAPTRKDLVFSTPSWTVGTPGRVRGPVVREPLDDLELEANREQFRGAWVLMRERTDMRWSRQRQGLCWGNELDQLGILGRIYSSGGPYVWGHGTWMDFRPDRRPSTPLLMVRYEDYGALDSALNAGEAPKVEAHIENRFFPGPIPVHNVIAEIRGSERPDEYVLLVAHLDTWDPPGSQGACDNGTGVVAVMEAARLLAAAGATPKRTIQFVLVGAEEQGLLGSTAFVQQRRDRLDRISAVFVEDSGPLWHAAVAAPSSMAPVLRRAGATLRDAFPDMPFQVRETRRYPRGGGSDHAPFLAAKVPAFFMVKGGSFPYGRVWHTHLDRVDQVTERWLVQMSLTMAILSYNVANAEEVLPRIPPTDPE